MLTFGSLFAGIGGFDLGLERAGMRCLWQVEIDDYARRVLAKHWPDVARYGDVRECGADNLARVDLICGGFPCQDISVAGKLAGLEGGQSGLWSEFNRTVCELKPRWVVVENVRNLLAIDAGRAMGAILRDLAESGYDAWWDVLPAAAVGAPHQRDRVFIVAYSHADRGGREANEKLHGAEAADTSVWDSFGGYVDGLGDEVANANYEGESGNLKGEQKKIFCGADVERCGWWISEPDVGRVADGVPQRVDRLRCLGNAVVPQVAEWIGRRIMASEEGEG